MRLVEFIGKDGTSRVMISVDQVARLRIENGLVVIEGGGVATWLHAGHTLDEVTDKLRKD